MAKGINRLTNAGIAHCKPGKYRDGAGLILRHRPPGDDGSEGQKNWILQYTFKGRTREMGLGSYFHFRGPGRGFHSTSLAEARAARDAALALLQSGRDPLEERRKARVEVSRARSFDEVAADYIEGHAAAWRGPKSRSQWEASLKAYVSPIFGSTPIDQIDVPLVLQAIEPIWVSKTETADRVRLRIKLILHAAMARGLRGFGVNPASSEALSHVLPAKRQLRKVTHLAACPFTAIPALMGQLSRETSVAAAALAFVILTAARVSEACGATWGEIGEGLWTIPAARMKSGRTHRVPLSAPALAVLDKMRPLRRGDDSPIFPTFNPRARNGLNGKSLGRVLSRLNVQTATVHGFRASFSTWVSEETEFGRDTVEEALAHVVGNATERSYRRGEALGKRRLLLDSWGQFCTGTERGAKVIQLKRKSQAGCK
jgi:integrase